MLLFVLLVLLLGVRGRDVPVAMLFDDVLHRMCTLLKVVFHGEVAVTNVRKKSDRQADHGSDCYTNVRMKISFQILSGQELERKPMEKQLCPLVYC